MKWRVPNGCEIGDFSTHPVFSCFEKEGIPNFFTPKAVILRAIYEEKMKKFEDDVF